jgi:Tn3 transposase DDE domain
MSDSELAVVSPDSFATPTIIARAGPTTRKKFFEFFTVPIRSRQLALLDQMVKPVGNLLVWRAFTRAVSVGNPREFLQAEKEDQEMAEACKRLIKNCIICWNYLYLSQKLAQIDDPAKREELLQAIAHGSAAAWGHLNLLGEYDFSEDKLQDSVGIKPPKLTD